MKDRLLRVGDRSGVFQRRRRVVAHIRKLADVRAGAEVATGSGQHYRVHRPILAQTREQLRKATPHGLVAGVAALRPIDGDDGCPVARRCDAEVLQLRLPLRGWWFGERRTIGSLQRCDRQTSIGVLTALLLHSRIAKTFRRCTMTVGNAGIGAGQWVVPFWTNRTASYSANRVRKRLQSSATSASVPRRAGAMTRRFSNSAVHRSVSTWTWRGRGS